MIECLSEVDAVLTPVGVVDGEGAEWSECGGVVGVADHAYLETAVAATTLGPKAQGEPIEAILFEEGHDGHAAVLGVVIVVVAAQIHGVRCGMGIGCGSRLGTVHEGAVPTVVPGIGLVGKVVEPVAVA